MTRHLLRVGAAALIAGLAGCGGGGAETKSAESAARVVFSSATTSTVFSSGSASFRISPALAFQEQASCTLNGAAMSPCIVSADEGRATFADLAPGVHELIVAVGAERFAHTIEVRRVRAIVFGGTPGGITAAIAIAQSGQPVVLLEPTPYVGGMMSAGLAKTDVGARGAEVIGGLTATFFRAVREMQAAVGACTDACADSFDFAPHVAEDVFERMLSDAQVVVERSVALIGVDKDAATLRAVQTSRGRVEAEVFIDASYEGDLMAQAGVAHAIGREARSSSSAPAASLEDHAGVQRYRLPFAGVIVDPYNTPGDAGSGVLPYIEQRPPQIASEGEADGRVMAYTYRLCVTDDPSNRTPFTAPEGYEPAHYEAMARIAEARANSGEDLAAVMFNPARTVRSKNTSFFKYDLNGGSTFSTDMTAPELNQAYVGTDAAGRERIRDAYRSYVQGLLYAWQTDTRFGGLNAKMARFGLCADEFVERGGWPHLLYVRESRRMIGEYVMNEADVLQNGRRPPITDVVAFGAYDIDMHTYRYFAAPVDWAAGVRRDAVVIEGFKIVRLPDNEPYPISYRSLAPRTIDAINLLNPVTLSATHVAYSSLRMEPTFMMLGEAAGVAASIAIEQGGGVQAVHYGELQRRLLDRGARLSL